MHKTSWYIVVLIIICCSNVKSNDLIGSYDISRCSTCSGLQQCTTLNSYAVPDPIIGYTRDATSQLEKQGRCMDYDLKATTVELFGPQYQFKDTPECRALVYQYNCAAWATKDNTCSNAPLRPCRSFCVEVADKCVFRHFYRPYLETVCASVPCSYIGESECIKGERELVEGSDRCTLHQYVPEEGILSIASSSVPLSFITLTIAIMTKILYF